VISGVGEQMRFIGRLLPTSGSIESGGLHLLAIFGVVKQLCSMRAATREYHRARHKYQRSFITVCVRCSRNRSRLLDFSLSLSLSFALSFSLAKPRVDIAKLLRSRSRTITLILAVKHHPTPCAFLARAVNYSVARARELVRRSRK